MADPKIIQEWLTQADEDFEFASVSLDEHDRFYSRICFHFQQAAEKYLKAYIIANNLPFRKIHDLTQLLKICQRGDNSFTELSDETQLLTDYYVNTRYPAFWPVGTTRQETEKAKLAASNIRDFVRERLSDNHL